MRITEEIYVEIAGSMDGWEDLQMEGTGLFLRVGWLKNGTDLDMNFLGISSGVKVMISDTLLGDIDRRNDVNKARQLLGLLHEDRIAKST